MAFAPVASGDLIQAETINNLVSGSVWYSNDSGTANAYEVTFDGSGSNGNLVSVLTSGQFVSFGALNTNTGPSTLAVLGVGGTVLAPGPRNITKGGRSLLAGEIRAGQIVQLVYNGNVGSWELLNSAIPALVQAHGVELVTTLTYTLPNNTLTVSPNWTSANWQSDSSAYWTSGNQITIPAGLGGKYFVRAVCQLPPIEVSCVVSLQIDVNSIGSQLQGQQRTIPISGGANTIFDLSVVLNVVPGDQIRMRVLQTSGASVNVVLSGTSLQAIMIGV